MFGKVKRAVAAYRVYSIIDDIIQEWNRKKGPMETKHRTLISAAIAAIMVFVGNYLGWDAAQIQTLSATLVGLVFAIMGQGIGEKNAAAKVEAAKLNGVREPGGNAT